MNKSKVIFRIESELLSKLLDYAVPFLNKKISIKKTLNENNSKIKNLEGILNSKPKIDFKGIKELESLLFKNLNENVKANKNIKLDSDNASYSLNFIKQKNDNNKNNNYSILIEYKENESNEKLKILIEKDDKEVYSAEILNKK